MSSVQHLNTKVGAVPYKGLFSTVSIVPPNTTIAYISTQWAADPKTGELPEGAEVCHHLLQIPRNQFMNHLRKCAPSLALLRAINSEYGICPVLTGRTERLRQAI